jgi:hypothetical protein
MNNSGAKLTSGCPICDKKEKLLRCAGCKVAQYCGREHQVAHRSEHKKQCNEIKRLQERVEYEKRKLPAEDFKHYVGDFWSLFETRDYMTARFFYAEAVLEIKSLEAVQTALDTFMDMLRLCRGDNQGLRFYVPALLLRLGRDQDAYDFIMAWRKIYLGECDPDDGAPFEKVKGGDVFENVDSWTKGNDLRLGPLPHAAALILLKIRLLRDLEALQHSDAVKEKVPQEVLDNIRTKLASPIIAGNRQIIERGDHSADIARLKSQISALVARLKRNNEHFWPMLLDPGAALKTKPTYYSMGTREESIIAVQQSFDSWDKTPGARAVLEELLA